MILITGATGNVGRRAALGLADAGKRVRALVRDPKKAGLLLHRRIETFHSDFDDEDGLERAFHGVDAALFLVPFGPDQVQWTDNLIHAARRAGVHRVVNLSVLGAAPSACRVAAWSHASDRDIEAAGFGFTHLRCALMAQSLLAAAPGIARGEFDMPLRDARIAFIDANDVADVVLNVLRQEGHEGRSYDLTGPEALTGSEVAERLAALLGRSVRYNDLPRDQACEVFMEEGMAKSSAELFVELLTDHFGAGTASRVSRDAERLLGRPPGGLDAFLLRQRRALLEATQRDRTH